MSEETAKKTPTEEARVETSTASPQPAPPRTASTAEGVDLGEVAEALLQGVPEHLKATIPDTSPSEQILWFRKAEKSGAFAPPKVPTTDVGRPRVTPVAEDISKLHPMQKIARGYTQK